MNKNQVQDCVHRYCKEIIYVPYYRVGLPVMCDKCIAKKETQNG